MLLLLLLREGAASYYITTTPVVGVDIGSSAMACLLLPFPAPAAFLLARLDTDGAAAATSPAATTAPGCCGGAAADDSLQLATSALHIGQSSVSPRFAASAAMSPTLRVEQRGRHQTLLTLSSSRNRTGMSCCVGRFC